jgi:hypothetical protein
VHIPDTAFTALDDHPFFFVASKRVEKFSGQFISYQSAYGNRQGDILSISPVLIFGSAWLAWFGFKNAFVSVCQQSIFILGSFENNRSSFPAITAGWTSKWDSHLSPAGHDTISSLT